MNHKRMRTGLGVVLSLAVAGLAVSACASASLIPLRGTPADLALLTGEWNGTYTSKATGRSGVVWFKLVEGEDHAHGDVLMTASGTSVPYYRYGLGEYNQGQRQESQSFLSIRFVRSLGSNVEGLLDPYWDATCRCEAVTSFRGQLVEDRLLGTFVTRFGGDAVATGRWEATRRHARNR